MVVQVDKEDNKVYVIDRAIELHGYWDTRAIKNFKSRAVGWTLQVELCQQVENENDCNILMIRDIEAHFCKKVNSHAVHDPLHLSHHFNVANYKRLLKALFEAVRNNCDNYLDVILRNGPLFVKPNQQK